jgi:hypothetical protein
MAVTAKITNCRIILADDKKKSLCSYSGLNPALNAITANSFANAVSALMDKAVNHQYVERTYELKDE